MLLLTGELLYPLVNVKHPGYASKVTGMFLDLENSEILKLINYPKFLDAKMEEAINVLKLHGIKNHVS